MTCFLSLYCHSGGGTCRSDAIFTYLYINGQFFLCFPTDIYILLCILKATNSFLCADHEEMHLRGQAMPCFHCTENT